MKRILIESTSIIMLVLFTLVLAQSIYTQEDSTETTTKTEDRSDEDIVNEQIEILVEEYNSVVKDNGGWQKEYDVIKQIKERIDNNFHNSRGYEALIKFYYKYGPLSQVRKYGQKAIDVSNSMGKIYFTRDIVYRLGLYYVKKKSNVDYGKALGYFNFVNAMGNDDKSPKSELLYYMGVCYYNIYKVRENENDRRFLYLAQTAYEFSVFLEENIENLYDLGNVYAELKEYGKAIKSYNKALDINPSVEKVINAKKEIENMIGG